LEKFHLLLLIHSHQPVGNFESVLESAYQQSYLPFLETLARHPAVRIGLHYSGPLLEWMEAKRPEFFERLRGLVAGGQVEMVGGGFYEPILAAIPAEDRREQIRRMTEYLEKHFGRRPAGLWLTERVWEPHLPESLAAAGVSYTLVDDIHFLSAGFDLAQLHGYYIAEEQGLTVKVIPGLKALRYLIPFGGVEETLEFLRRLARENPGGFAAMGDDCEKFGVWPETHKHCYTNGWLERFFTALEAAADWLACTLPGDALEALHPLGRADLPTSSYTEMGEWALPTPARQRFHALLEEFSARPDVLTFLRGSFWRNFLSKYPEANLLHKKMLHVSAKIRQVGSAVRRGLPLRRALDRATTHLLRAQCNDAYWHGIFGGLYSPHLRAAVWSELIHAENLADAAGQGSAVYAETHRLDFDADGHEEIYCISDTYAAVVKPSDGGTLASLDFRPCGVALVNSIARRPEAYHARLREKIAPPAGGVASIHGQTKVKEAGLDRWLKYDHWPRHCFRLLVFPAWKTWEDYAEIRLEESPTLAAWEYAVASSASERVELVCDAPMVAPAAGEKAQGPALRVSKSFLFTRTGKGFELACHLALTSQSAEPLRLLAGLELVINLLAPDEPDRYFDITGMRQPLRWGGTAPSPDLRMVDEWQNVSVGITAPGAREFWVAPIETVTESEEGFERVYQGSQILPVWLLELAPGGLWTGRMTLRVGQAKSTTRMGSRAV
jgi:hypothetical protein